MERRRSPRQHIPYKVMIRTDDGRVVNTYTEDISESGIKCGSSLKLEEGSAVALEITLDVGIVKKEGRVVWAKEKESRCCRGMMFYNIGIGFRETGKRRAENDNVT